MTTSSDAPPPSLQPSGCLQRQQRVARLLQQQQLDTGLFVSPELVQYLTGFRPHRLLQAAVVLTAEGHCTLFAPNSRPDQFAADEVYTFAAQQRATIVQQQTRICLDAVFQAWTRASPAAGPRRMGTEFTSASLHLQALAGEAGVQLIDVDEDLWKLRRNKDADELQMMAFATACTEAMYRRAREIICPGITELDVYGELHRVAVLTAGQALTALGNDFQCASPGGPPRPRSAQAGELYILDLGPCVGGYFADNCRTISVDGQPTKTQMAAWQVICDVLQMVEQTVQPGLSCRHLYEEAKKLLDAAFPSAFPHHLGHGLGLFPHEAPHLNPHWDDAFAVGDVFTVEPGLYADGLRAGIRLEQNYRVTSTGVECLTPFPLGLTSNP